MALLIADSLVDISSITPSILQYVLVGTATISGFFVDSSGSQTGVAQTGSVTTTPQTLLTCLGLTLATLPEGAVGFVGKLSADIYYGLGGTSSDGVSIASGLSADMVSHSSTKYPVLTATNDLRLGRA